MAKSRVQRQSADGEEFIPPVIWGVKDLTEEIAVVGGLVELSLCVEEPSGVVESGSVLRVESGSIRGVWRRG